MFVLFFFLSVCLSVYFSACLSACLPASLPVYLPSCMSVCLFPYKQSCMCTCSLTARKKEKKAGRQEAKNAEQLPNVLKTYFFKTWKVISLQRNVWQTKYNVIYFFFFLHILFLFEFKLRFQGKIVIWLQHPALILSLILYGLGGGRKDWW